MIAQELEVSLHTAFVEARQKRHEFITVEHLLLALERELAAPADEDELIDKWADLFPDEDDSAEAADGETGETVAELEDVVETEDVDEVADQLGDVDDDGASER